MVAFMLQWNDEQQKVCVYKLYLIHIIYDDEKNQIRDDIERKEWR